MSIQVQNEVPSLSINQRNLYLYYLNHKKKHKDIPCFVPKISVKGNGVNDYIKLIGTLEELNLVRIDRTAENYTGWVLLDPITDHWLAWASARSKSQAFYSIAHQQTMEATKKYPEFPINEYAHLQRITRELSEIIQRDTKRHQMDEHLTSSMRDLLEYEIIPMLENELDYDPTPQYLYDDTGGEPAVSASERHATEWREHQMAKRGLTPQS